MKPCLSELKNKDIEVLINFNILETKEGKTTKFLHSTINIGSTFTYLKVGTNLYQMFFSSGNFYPNIYKVYAWKHDPSYKPIDYYIFQKKDNDIKVFAYYGNLNKRKLLN